MTPEQQKLADKCTRLQRDIVINIVTGKMSQRKAYLAAGGKAKTENTQDASVSEILRNPKVKEFYNSLLAEASTNAVMTRTKALEALTKVANTIDGVIENHDPKKRSRLPIQGQIAAIKQIAEMEGWEAPKKVAPCTPDGEALVLNFIPVGKKQG